MKPIPEKVLALSVLLFASCLAQAQIPNGYYSNAEGKTGDELKAALHDIIKGHTTIAYSNIWNAFWSTDNKGNGIVWDMYSDIPNGTPPYTFEMGQNQCGSYQQEGDCYNREHSWPESWFNSDGTARTDLHQIFPTDGYVNARRSNYPFGEVQSATWTSQNGSKLGNCKSSLGYSGTVFEPIDAYKGDFARAIMYMSVRYYSEDSNWGTSGMTNKSEIEDWAIEMLMDWNEQDPVSDKETARNNAIYTDYQHNRNPFVDHPEYARLIWDENASGGSGGGGNSGNEPSEGDYVKVTSAPSDWSGEYLIVYEGGNVAFNGALTTLDATNNTIAVNISDNAIASTDEIDAATFTIAPTDGGYSIKSASGYYIGQTSDANGLQSNQTTIYVNTLAYNGGDIDIVGSGRAYLRFNAASGQNRFRYYKSGTYTNQQAIQLYKKTVTTTTQAVSLSAGWNWWAPIVATTPSALQTALGDLTIEAQNGTTPESLVPGQMYKVHTPEGGSFTLSGTMPSSVSYAFGNGPNWFGTTAATNLDDLGITPASGDKIVSQDGGFAIYNGNAWTGTLTTLQPGKGYLYISTH